MVDPDEPAGERPGCGGGFAGHRKKCGVTVEDGVTEAVPGHPCTDKVAEGGPVG